MNVKQIPVDGAEIEEQGWRQLQSILSKIIPPIFPNRDFVITEYGAIGDGVTDCTEAFRKVITLANNIGGGRVVVPAGIYLTGPIHFKSNINLHVSKEAIIKFSQELEKYLPMVLNRFEGVELYNYSPLIYSYEAENLAITGEGVLDGNGDKEHWWPWKGKKEYGWQEGQPHQAEDRDILFAMAERNVSVKERRFGSGHYLRPSFIQFYNSKNILIEGVTIKDSPMWQISPVLCENITIDKVKIIGHGPNTDGFDPDSCKNVVIKNCYFDNGDDCIAIKSGRNADGRRINIPCENIVIQNNYMKDGHGGITIGSEISGSVRNVFADNNVMDSLNLDRALRFKTNSVRGGIIENIYFRNTVVKSIGEEILIVDMNYEEGDVGEYTPIIRNIFVENLESYGGKTGFLMSAYKRTPITNVQFKNCTLHNVEIPFVFKNVEQLVFKNVNINGENYDSVRNYLSCINLQTR
ncbi:glycoside hydrolase family 28 protein [Pelosinus propionicus]|uniref:Polygalacturonase n=1 Tax=Pelosinus propionicus DSM 13327 TaxID=1123291 RepID=A0A1I4JVD5_9FIRM|nr:glycoside hydrolase family 28 protein [Pelosinus propionicus]SFL70502.1 Polygalacturonase [Pelosinus propionicus DSM 13327]